MNREAKKVHGQHIDSKVLGLNPATAIIKSNVLYLKEINSHNK